MFVIFTFNGLEMFKIYSVDHYGLENMKYIRKMDIFLK